MANSATPLAKIPSLMKMNQGNGLVTPVVVVLDTAADQILYTPASGNFAACVGMNISESGAFVGIMKSALQPLFNFEISANSPPIFKRIGFTIFQGRLSEALVVTVTSGAISQCLLYFAEFPQMPTEL